MHAEDPTGNFAPMSPSKAGQAFPSSKQRSKAGQAYPSNSPRKTSSPRKTMSPRKTFSPRKTGTPHRRLTNTLRPGTAESSTEQRELGIEKALSTLIAEALRHRCCDYSVDAAWMGTTHESWRTVLAGSIHKSSLNRRLAAGGSMRAIQAAPVAQPAGDRSAEEAKPANQVHIASTPPPLNSIQVWSLLSDCAC